MGKKHWLGLLSYLAVQLSGVIGLIIANRGVLNLGDILIYSYGAVVFSLGLVVSDLVMGNTPDDAV